MAEPDKVQAEGSTSQTQTGCPTWDNMGATQEILPFFSPNEDLKRQGFKVRFLGPGPRKETPNALNPEKKDLWFDIEYKGEKRTWTINQVSLLLELKKYEPLTDKTFHIQLIRVDEKFRKEHPNYKGKDRYVVTFIDANADPVPVEDIDEAI